MNNLNQQKFIAQLNYDRSTLNTRIVHLGFGGFYRAHVGLYNHKLAQLFKSDWGTCVVNLFSQQLIKDLQQQDNLYSVTELDSDQQTTYICGAVKESLNPVLNGIETIIEKMSEPQIAIVSLTLTEKGYCIDPNTRRLDLNNQWIVHDLSYPESPQSAIGFIVAALKRRKDRGLSSFSVLPCDNLTENGHVTKQAILTYANKLDPALAHWIEQNATFPSTMVDRIVPAITPEANEIIKKQLEIIDPCGIVCESFEQWVIEDNFVSGRPAWENVGAQLVKNVLPYELMKLRMLNGSHSFLAYLGYLGGYETIYECMQDPYFKETAYQLMIKEQASTLTEVDLDLTDYADELIKRFDNSNIKHRTWQIAKDGSQKLPQRWLPSVLFHLEHKTPFPCLALSIAGWMRYVSGIDEQGQPIEIDDPMAKRYKEIYKKYGLNIEVVPHLLAIEQIFDPKLANDERFINEIKLAYQNLLQFGAKQSIKMLQRSVSTA